MHIFTVKLISHPLRIGKSSFIEALLPPLIVGPRYPVKHYTVKTYTAFTILVCDRKYLVLRFISLLRLNISERPLRKHHRFTGDLPEP